MAPPSAAVTERVSRQAFTPRSDPRLPLLFLSLRGGGTAVLGGDGEGLAIQRHRPTASITDAPPRQYLRARCTRRDQSIKCRKQPVTELLHLLAYLGSRQG